MAGQWLLAVLRPDPLSVYHYASSFVVAVSRLVRTWWASTRVHIHKKQQLSWPA
jgi:hypothetical protein